MHGGTTQPGHYELRDEVVRGVRVVGVWWIDQGHRSRLLNLDADRVPLLGEAVADYLASSPADAE